MTRPHRVDEPHALFHVTVRAIARRAMFEDEIDYRYYLACLARAVRRREIRVLAFCVLHSHVHVLVESLGELSQAFQQINSAYVRRFNRRRGRDGALQRGRYFARRVESEEYLRNVRAYIDENAVVAELAKHPDEYPWGSRYAVRLGRHRQWLAASMPALAATREAMQARAEWLERRARSASPLHPLEAQAGKRLADLPDEILYRSLLADGSLLYAPLVGVLELGLAIERAQVVLPQLVVGLDAGWEDTRCGLLRDVAGLTFRAVATVASVGSPSTARRRWERHRRALADSALYRRRVAALIDRAREARGGV
ncbi:MAG: transposase [Planctomycetota bacterium]